MNTLEHNTTTLRTKIMMMIGKSEEDRDALQNKLGTDATDTTACRSACGSCSKRMRVTPTKRLLFEFTIPRIKFSNNFRAELGHDISGKDDITTTTPGGAGIREVGNDTDTGDEVRGAVRTNSGIVNEVVN